ncbi:Rrf2 family transcriptional regulator [Flavobacteriaceae bacterium TK19130]|nr:Rrf2 family transcriptional regulator [Thermobacterium salinum]
MFSKACEYGIRATLFISKESRHDRRSNLKEIAKAIDSPEAFTAKILQELARSGVVKSKKGPNGGFFVEEDHRILLGDIVEAIDGDSVFRGCGLGLSECSDEKPCPLHEDFLEIREGLREMLETVTITTLTESLDNGETFLKRF